VAVVAVFNSSQDTVELLQVLLQREGWSTVAGHIDDLERGRLDLVRFVEQHRPAVVVSDVAMPYADNWAFLRLVRDSAALRDVPFVATTTNKPALEQLVGPETAGVIEIVGKPSELDRVVEAVHRAIGRAPGPGAPPMARPEGP